MPVRTLFLLLLRRHSRNKGFALNFVLLVGIMIASVTALTLIQSQAKRKFVQDSLETSKIRNAVEVAKIRMESLFIQHPMLLLHSADFWENALLNPDSSAETKEFVDLTRLCQQNNEWEKTKNQILQYAKAEEINLDNNISFRLVNLTQTNNNKALVTIQAQNRQGTTANLQGEVGYEFYYLQGNVPALWMITGGRRVRHEFDGDVWVNDCFFNKDNIRIAQPLKNQAIYVGYKFPELPDLDEIIERIPRSHILTLDDDYEGETSFPRSNDSPTRIIKGYTIYEYVTDQGLEKEGKHSE